MYAIRRTRRGGPVEIVVLMASGQEVPIQTFATYAAAKAWLESREEIKELPRQVAPVLGECNNRGRRQWRGS